jgi:hypothetical protein
VLGTVLTGSFAESALADPEQFVVHPAGERRGQEDAHPSVDDPA